MRYAALGALFAAFMLQIWFIYWKNADEPRFRPTPQDSLIPPDLRTPHLYTINAIKQARAAAANPDLGDNAIAGKVLLASGGPAPRAEVTIERRSLAPKDALRSLHADSWTAITNEDGGFSVETLPAGDFVVVAQTQGAMGLAGGTLTEGGAMDVQIELLPARPLAGAVKTPTGEAVPAATVYPVRASGIEAGDLFRLFPAKTALNGEFSFTELPVASWDLLIIAKDETPTLVQQVKNDGEPVSLTLKPGAAVSGRVRSVEDDKPVSGLPLVLVEKELGLERVTCRTDPAGVFAADNLRQGEYVIEVDSTRWALHEARPTVRTGVRAEGFTVAVEKTGSLKGVVVAQSDAGWGLPGVPVRAVPRGPGQTETVNTDRRGGYFFPGLKAGIYDISLVPGGAIAPQEDAPQEATVESGKRAEGPVFTVKEGAALRGEVVDLAGGAVSGAVVYLQAVEGDLRSGRTDKFGAFEFQGLRHEEELVVWADKEGMQSLAVGPSPAEALASRALRLQLELPNTASVSGRVVNAQGSGLGGILVSCEAEGNVKLPALRQQTAADGSFSFERLPAAAYQLQIAEEGRYSEVKAAVTLKDGEHKEQEILLP